MNRHMLFAAVVVAAAVSGGNLASAQSATTGTGDARAQNQPSIVGVSGENRARFRTYAMGAGVPSYRYGSAIGVGVVLPSEGVTYGDIPADYGVSGYRYAIVNDTPVIVEPGARRVIQVIE